MKSSFRFRFRPGGSRTSSSIIYLSLSLSSSCSPSHARPPRAPGRGAPDSKKKKHRCVRLSPSQSQSLPRVSCKNATLVGAPETHACSLVRINPHHRILLAQPLPSPFLSLCAADRKLQWWASMNFDELEWHPTQLLGWRLACLAMKSNSEARV